MQRDQVLAIEADQHARRPLRRQVRPDFPESVSQGTAQRHTHRPSPLRPQQVLAYRTALRVIQFLQPFPHRLATRSRAVKNQWDFLRLRVLYHRIPSLVQCTIKCAGRQANPLTCVRLGSLRTAPRPAETGFLPRTVTERPAMTVSLTVRRPFGILLSGYHVRARGLGQEK